MRRHYERFDPVVGQAIRQLDLSGGELNSERDCARKPSASYLRKRPGLAFGVDLQSRFTTKERSLQ